MKKSTPSINPVAKHAFKTNTSKWFVDKTKYNRTLKRKLNLSSGADHGR